MKVSDKRIGREETPSTTMEVSEEAVAKERLLGLLRYVKELAAPLDAEPARTLGGGTSLCIRSRMT